MNEFFPSLQLLCPFIKADFNRAEVTSRRLAAKKKVAGFLFTASLMQQNRQLFLLLSRRNKKMIC